MLWVLIQRHKQHTEIQGCLIKQIRVSLCYARGYVTTRALAFGRQRHAYGNRALNLACLMLFP